MERSEWVRRRKMMESRLEDGEAMLFFSGTGVRKSADEDYPFFSNRNFLYLTGIKQENTVLMLERENGGITEAVYIDFPDEAQERWTGRRMRPEEVAQVSGVEQIKRREQLERELHQKITAGKLHTLWLCLDRLEPGQAEDLEHGFCRKMKERYPYLTIKNSFPPISYLRKFKSKAELDAIRKGMSITKAGICRMMQAARPGMMEYQLEAEFDYVLQQHGQRNTAFPSIIAYGERNFYLHYPLPMGKIGEDGLILVDVGAPFDDYCTDISRVFPANGRFSQRQAAIYQIALRANREIMAQIQPGRPFSQNDRICRQVVFEGLSELGLIHDFKDISKYVWHGVTHHVGLDTHDVGGYEGDMMENMVLTVDAGIYVPEWGIGLRIEDNVVVTENGCENLSADIPTEIDEIEELMKG